MWIQLQLQATEFTKGMSIGLQEQARNAVLGMINKLYMQQCEMLFKKTVLDKELCFKKEFNSFVAKIGHLSKEQQKQQVEGFGRDAQEQNTKLFGVDDDQIRQSAIQVFQEIAEPARAAREETEETKEEETKVEAEDVNFARYAVLRSDAPCLRQAEVK